MGPVVIRRVCISDNAIVGARTPSVLVTLEDANLRAAASRVLTRAGYRVLTAPHSGHALLACLTGGRIDVLLSELRMEDGSGRALAERLRRHNPDLRGVYFSSDRGDACDEVLIRPITADDLLRAVSGLFVS
jgi:two-component system, cell cycle sensor histidine kinase and response regulator CckA